MMARRQHINRVLSRDVTATIDHSDRVPIDAPRQLRRMLVDFSSLHLPAELSRALADAFWNQVGVRAAPTVRTYWHHMRIFGRFVAETQVVNSISDVGTTLLVRYIEWLNKQRSQEGKPWSKGTRYSTYTTLRTLLLWVLQNRPGVLGEIEFPLNPFPWKNRDVERVSKIPAQDLRAILRACERDITDSRAVRDEAEKEIAASRISATDSIHTRGDLLRFIDERYGGIVPPWRVVHSRGHCALQQALAKHGYGRRIERYLYPQAESIFAYYLAILIHSAGNPEAIAALEVDCVQPIPLLDDRELLVWSKPRASALQRRSFRNLDSFEPPMLVRELLQWTQRLRPHAAVADRHSLFLYKSTQGVSALSMPMIKQLDARFVTRHRLPHFTFASIRPTVLSSIGRRATCDKSKRSPTTPICRRRSATWKGLRLRAQTACALRRCRVLFSAISSTLRPTRVSPTKANVDFPQRLYQHCRRARWCRCSVSTARMPLPASPREHVGVSCAPISWVVSPAPMPSLPPTPPLWRASFKRAIIYGQRALMCIRHVGRRFTPRNCVFLKRIF